MSFLRSLRHARRGAVIVSASALSAAALTAVAAMPADAAAVPRTPKFGAAIENLSPYQPQTKCHPMAQPGVVKFRALILATYKGTGDDGIVRACSSGGTSEHKDGRAWDWAVSYHNAHQVAQVHALFTWLFATDSYGHKYAMARRLGIMYMIWNKHIWGTYAATQGWRNYKCSGVTLCHQNHVHFSFSKAGASGKTSYWTKVVVNVGGRPGNGDTGGTHGGSGSYGTGSGSGSGAGGGTPSPTHDGDSWGSWGQPPTVPVLSDTKLPTTVAVPTDQHVRTSYALQAGHHYLVTVHGSYTFATVRTSWDGDTAALTADAECVQDPSWSRAGMTTTWTRTPSFAQDWANVAFDLAVDGRTSWQPTTDDGNGCNPTDHTYVLHLTPSRTAPLELDVIGGDRADATGTLDVTISRDGA